MIIGPSTDLKGDKRVIAKALAQGILQGGLGGSIKNKKGTEAWMVEPKTYQNHSDHSIRGTGLVDGDPEVLHFTRAERSAFLGPLYVAWRLTEECNLKKGKITMHVDNISSYLDRYPPRQGEGSLWHLGGDYDLKQMKKLCNESLEQRNIKVKWKHVKAHQDEKKIERTTETGKQYPSRKQH